MGVYSPIGRYDSENRFYEFYPLHVVHNGG